MKIVLVITHYHPVIFGAELFAKKIAEAATKDGHQVTVITGKWEKDWPRQETINQVKVIRVPVIKIRYLQTILATIPLAWALINFLRANPKTDWIHLHIFPSLLLTWITPEKTVVTIQGGDLADYPEIYGILAPVLKPVIGYSLKRAKRVHAVSSALASQVKKLSGQTAVKIPNGVEAEYLKQNYQPAELNQSLKSKLPQTKYLLVSTSRLTEKNNLARTIKAVSLVRSQGLDLGLVIAGSGHLETRLKSLVESLNLSREVKLVGAVNHNQVLSLVKQADAYVRVSLQEGFGISTLEAMAIGVPVISSQAGGLADFVSTQTAYVCQAESISSISKQIKLALTSDAKAKVNKAREMVKTKYTWDKIYSQVLKKLYQV